MHWWNHKTASISVKISQWDNSSHTEIMVIPKENLIAFLQKCHYIVKTQTPISTLLLFPQSSHMKKCHNNNWIHLALYSHKNISGNVGFWWHLRARKGWRKDEKWKRVGSRGGIYNATLGQSLKNVFKKYNWYSKKAEKMKSYKAPN